MQHSIDETPISRSCKAVHFHPTGYNTKLWLSNNFEHHSWPSSMYDRFDNIYWPYFPAQKTKLQVTPKRLACIGLCLYPIS